MFVLSQAAPPVDAGPGITRQVLGHDAELMMVRVTLAAGAVAPLHTHPHRQVTYVESGVFEATIDGVTRTLGAGDCYFVPPHAAHGVTTIQAGVLIDVFTPAREDFLG